MINQLRCRFAFDAQDAAVGMIMVRVEASDFTVCYRCDGGAVSRAKRTVAAHAVGTFYVISHRVKTMSKAEGCATLLDLETNSSR
jgi:hypothetical protein